MNWREKQLRFSIRKLKVAVASTVVGISVFGVATPAVQANQILPAQQASAVNYRYVLESELTDAEKNLIQTQLPGHQVGDYSTYYMVYRPVSQKATASSLPLTGMADEQLVAGLGLGLLIIGVSLVAGKKRRVISSIFFLTAAGAVSVSALGGGSLSVYDRGHQLAVGSTLPETAITIANHEFVGYILEKAALPVAKPTAGLDEPAQPAEETKPVQPTEPAQPELTTELQDIDFETDIIDDANLSLGQEVVAQEGRKGQKRLTFNGDQLVSEEVLAQPVNRVILRGTKPLATKEETRLEALPFTTEYQDDPSLLQGQEQVVREGQEGLRQDRYVNGQVVASEVLREPVNRLVKRGTKVEETGPVESTVYENVAFETIVEPDPTLPLGQEVVVQEGQTGRKESKYLDGQLVSSVILDAPVAQIIRRGTKVEGQEPVETVTYDEVAFESIVEEDPSLPVGEEVLAQAGQVGRKENKFLDGQLVSSQIVQEPVNQIIRKGTRVIEGTVEVSYEVELPFDTKVVADDSQYTDYQVTTPGQNGKAIVIDTYRTVNGVQVGLPISSRQETIDAPVDQVLTVGTKPIVDKTTVETLIDVQPDLETKYDDSQYADYNVTTPGQAGQIKRTETYVTVKGEKTGLPLDSKDEVISPATPTVVTIGTKPLEGTVDLSRLVELAFGTDTVTDENQYEDFAETIPGTPGQQEIIETFKTLKGEKIGEPIATAEGAVTAPVNAKIVTGTKPIVGSVEETREEEIAFTTETQYDDTKYTDYISETPGQLGAKILTEAFQTIKGEKVGQPTIKEERVTKEPVNHVIVIGTKPIEDTVLETRTEAYTVEPETRYAEEEYEDYSVEIEGTPGTKEISERFQTIKGEKVGLPSLVGETILVPATPKVFLIGSKAIEGQVTETRKEVIEPETVIVYDDTKYEDYREEIAGTPGEKEVTETFRTLKGDKTEIILESSEKVLAEPIAKQIILGRMALAGVESTERIMEVAYVTRLVEDKDQYFGYRKEEGGQPGTTKVYETYQTIKGVRTGEPTLDREEVLTAPVDLVVTVGVKPIVATDDDKQVIALPFNTTTVKDETKYTDYREVTTTGQDGQLERVTTYRTVRGQRVGEPISVVDKTLNEPVGEVITIGTKEIEGEVTLPPRTEERDFAVEEIKDPDRYTDYYHEEGGVKGEVEITETFKTIKGQIEGNPIKSEERVITDPVKKVITVGTKPLNGQTQVVREEAIPFDTEVKYDNDQYEDYAVETGGTPGKAEITETYNTFKGEAIGQPTASERVVKEEPVNNIRTVGTKPINWTETVVDKVALPFDTIEETDADQYEDYEVVRVEGVDGEKTITTVYKTVKGVRQPDPTVTEETTKPVVNKVIVKGTKLIYGEKPVTRTEPVDFTTREVKDPDQYTDYRKEEGGVAGVKTITEVFKTEKGELTTELLRSSEAVTTDPIEKVITVGTKPIYGEKPVISTEPIPVTEEIQLDPNKLASSSDEVLREGTEGIRTITKTYKTEKGVIVGDPIAESSAITTPMETRLIKRGTKVLEAEKQEPKAVVQTVAMTAEPIAEQSIQPGLENVRSYTWKENAKPSTTESSDSVSGTVIVTYNDGSTDEVPVTIIVRSEADKQAPAAKADQQVLGLNQTPVPSASIATEGLTNVASYTWLGEAPSTAASNANVPATVRVTYTDGSYDDVPVSIKVVSEADKQAPAAKADQQVLGLNQTPVPSASIATEGLTNVASYTWLGEAPSTAASNANVPATVRVTYTDGSYDDVPVSIKVVSEADKQAPAAKADQQVLGLNQTPVPSASIATEGLTNVASYTWLGEAPSTAASNANVPATVRVTYTDGSYDDVPVSIKVVSEADKQAPTAKEPKQVVGLNGTPSAEASIETSGLTNVDTYTWFGSAPATTASNPNATGTVRVTYTDGSYDDVPVSITVQSEADKQNPAAKEPKQVVGLNSTPSAEASIETSGLTNVDTYTWLGSAPATTASNPNATGTVRVTYTDGSYDDVPVSITVQSEADKQNPTAKAEKQVVGLNVTPDPETSINTIGLERVRSYTWKPGATPVTTASNPAATGTVLVTYEDGSVDEVAVDVIVQSEADKQNPTAKAEKQVVGLNVTPDPEASINTTGLERVRSYTWKPGATPVTTASNPAATGTVLVTYEDGSVDEVSVEVIVRSEADKQNPTAKAEKQVVGLNVTPDPETSINTTGLERVRSYTWKPGATPVTTASNPAATGTVLVTYEDGSVDEVAVDVVVQSDADRQTPRTIVQKVNLKDTPNPEKSIEAGLPTGTSYAWKDGVAPVTTASTMASGQGVAGTVIVTYPDGSKDEVQVTVQVESDADRGNPTPATAKQSVKVDQQPVAADSINKEGLAKVATYEWKTAPDTSAAVTDLDAIVVVTYEDGSKDEVPVKIEVLPNKTKPTLVLEKLTELDDDKKINLNYELTDPTNAKTSIKYEIYNGTEKVKEGTVDSNNPFDVDGLDWHIPYTLKTTMTYDLGQGPVVETLEDVPFELEYKRVELRHVDAAELYHKQPDGSYSRIDKLSEAPTNFDDYYVKVVDDQQKDLYLAVTKVEASTVGDRATFKFTAVAPQLIEHNATKTDNVENYTFHVPKVVPSEPGKPRTFADLVAAMTANPTARIELTEDLDASNFALATAATSYIPGTFTGQLIGNNYSITGLTAPLFDNLGSNAVVDGVRLTNVNINKTSQNIFGSLAKRATGSRITNVAVQGTLNGERTLGGIVGAASNTTFENVAFDGAITTVHQWQEDYTGGIVGDLAGTSLINKAKVNINLKATPNQNPGFKGFGAIVGRAQHTGSLTEGNVRNIEATGSVTNTWPASAGMQPTPRMGGLIGYANTNVRLRNAVSSVKVERGSALIGVAVNTANLDETVTLVEGTSVVKVNAADTTTEVKSTKSPEDAKAQADSFAITISNEVSRPNINKYDVDYTTVAGYNPANDLKYANTEKLLPFYNKEFIVKQGNLLTTGRLATDKVVSVVPMVDNKTVSDYLGQKDAINKLLVHYADGTVEELTLSFKETFKDTGIQEYRVNGGEVLFTPNQMTNRNQEIVDAVKATLQGLDYYDANILTKLKKTLATGETATDAMDKLYLKESFNEVKGKISEVLSGILATSNVVTTSNQELTKFITDNKEELMIGLAYVNRWYNINFGDFNAKDLILNNQDFYGKPVDTLNFLVNLAKGGYNDLRAHNNVATYEKHFAPLTGKATLFDYLGDLRKKFTEFATDAEWFNATTTAHIVETKSVHRPDLDMSAYNRMVKTTGHQNGVLPLLTAQEGIYILSNMATLSYGMFDRYFDMNLKNTDPATYATKVEEVKAKANEAGHLIGVYFDTWHRLNPNNQQDALDNSIPVWDAYSNSKGTYLKRWGEVDTNQSIQDFFGPILPDITATTGENRRGYHIKINNGSSGIAYGDYVTYMLTFNLLDKRGLSIFTHENIHNMENKVYMGGFDRRLGIMPEFYPLGVLQAPEGGVPTNTKLGFNTMFDFTANVDDTTRLVNASPDRFQNQGDLQEYLKGSFDVLYLLDYAEATSILSKDTATKQKFWAKIENNYRANSGITNAFAVNAIRPLTAEEAASLTSLDDLINQSILGRRETWNGNAKQELTRNGYFRLGMFAPNYSALSNPDGSPGDFMFRRMAFELLAEKGYDQGFLPYASNQLGTEAAAQNRYGTDDWWFNRRMPFPTDEMIFKHIFGNTYADWNAFKKDMFQQRIAKKDQLKPITITYQGRTETINSFDRLQALMTEAVDYDARTANSHDIRISRVHALKAAIYNAYLRQSKDFEESIFNN